MRNLFFCLAAAVFAFAPPGFSAGGHLPRVEARARPRTDRRDAPSSGARCPAASAWEKARGKAIADRIAAGHSWTKHRSEYQGVRSGGAEVATQEAFQALLESVVQSDGEGIGGGRRKWWDGRTRTIVIFNPRDPDCRTAFRPSAGKRYYDNQR